MRTSTYRVIDLHNAPGGGEALARIDLTADVGLVLARPGPAAPGRPQRWDLASPARACQPGQ